MSLVNITLSFLLYLAGPLLMLLSLLMFRSCLLNQIYLFQDKSFKTQTMTQQGRQLLDVDEMSMSNLDWAGLGWTKKTENVQVPRDSDRKRATFLIDRVYSPFSAQSSYQRWTTPLQQPPKRIFGILSLKGSLREACLGIVWDCSPSCLKSSSL
jgi:hypothetical protein